MFTCALIVKLVIVISPYPLSDMQLCTMNDLRNLLFFLEQSSLFHLNGSRKVPASPPYSMQVFDSSLNITFIQLFTCYDHFLLVHFNLFFSLCVSAGFYFI